MNIYTCCLRFHPSAYETSFSDHTLQKDHIKSLFQKCLTTTPPPGKHFNSCFPKFVQKHTTYNPFPLYDSQALWLRPVSSCPTLAPKFFFCFIKKNKHTQTRKTQQCEWVNVPGESSRTNFCSYRHCLLGQPESCRDADCDSVRPSSETWWACL